MGLRYLTQLEVASEKSSQRRKTPDIVQVSQRKKKEGSMHKDIMSKNMTEKEYGMVCTDEYKNNTAGQ